jgi:multiple antibiotic resistance protein
MPHQIVDSFITFLVVLDPIGVAVIFAGLMRGAPAALRRRMAWRSTLIAGVLLFGFAAGGAFLFDALGISLPAFRIAGGLLLFLLATDMVFARPSGIRNPTRPEQEEAAHSDDISVFPLAFPLLAGPGALTSVVLLIGRAETPLAVAAVIGSLLVVLALTLAALLAAAPLMRVLGVTGANVVGRVLGIILAALAAQFVIDGIEGMLH